MFKTILSLILCSLFWSLAEAAKASQPLNQALVKKYYGEGDFDPAIAILEDFQKTNSTFSREESLMVYKYLGVMYCADQGSREKGKSYFYKLLKIEPEAKILDMYVSIVVQDIFKGTLDELMGQSGFASSQKLDKVAFSSPKENRKPERQEKTIGKKHYAAFWWAGGVALAAGVAGGYYLYASSETVSEPDSEILITP